MTLGEFENLLRYGYYQLSPFLGDVPQCLPDQEA
jgi:hypothetical protein